jgi:UDP-2,4-diacetamido-2,4,6-trideoxy-beta-L-altropyranose hydrolase
MNCVFRVDASTLIGTGHLVRCLTLANALKQRGAKIHFISRDHSGHPWDTLLRDGYSVTLLPKPQSSDIKKDKYEDWLGVSQDDDAVQTIQALCRQQYDWLIVDHYGLDQIWERQLRSHISKLMVIDDLANRNHDCDVLLDQSYSIAGEERYQSKIPKYCKLLLGPRYALLKYEYAKFRALMSPRSGYIKRILIYMGGGNNNGIVNKVLFALSAEQFTHLKVDLVMGASCVDKGQTTSLVDARPNTQIHFMRPHLADLMANSDLAIGAGGSTMWERICMGLPSLVISIAENQVPSCQALALDGVIFYLGDANQVEVKDIRFAISNMIDRSQSFLDLAIKNQTLVDGQGANRVVETLLPSSAANLTLRTAKITDALTYFAWANDPSVRLNANNSDLINFETHLHWFNEKLNNKNCFLYVLEADNLPVGQVRFDVIRDVAIIDYSLDILVRGRGWAKFLLKLGMEQLASIKSVPFIATVKSWNIASAKVFSSIGFVETTKDEKNNNRNFLYKRNIQIK